MGSVAVVDLRVTLGRLVLNNPVLVASGTFGYVREMAPFVRLDRLGGVIPKTVTFRPRAGNPTPRTVETASGLLNAIGLDNDGIAHFIEHHLPYLRTVGTAVIANIAGEDEDQFVAMAEMLGAEPGLAAIELNISCPNVSHGLDLGIDANSVGRLVRRVRAGCPLPIVAKLTPNVTDVVPIAAAAAEAGADAVSLINTVRGMAVDWRRRRPILAYDVGGLSGPAIKPIALRIVWEVSAPCPACRSSASAASRRPTMPSSSSSPAPRPSRSAPPPSTTPPPPIASSMSWRPDSRTTGSPTSARLSAAYGPIGDDQAEIPTLRDGTIRGFRSG